MQVNTEYYEKLKEILFHLSKGKFRQFTSEEGGLDREARGTLLIDYIHEASKKMPSIMRLVDE